MEPSESFQHIRKSLHDLSQPLAAVTGLVDLLLLEMEGNDSFFHEVQMISEQLEKVLSIVGEIRHMAQQAADDLLKPQPQVSLRKIPDLLGDGKENQAEKSPAE